MPKKLGIALVLVLVAFGFVVKWQERKAAAEAALWAEATQESPVPTADDQDASSN